MHSRDSFSGSEFDLLTAQNAELSAQIAKLRAVSEGVQAVLAGIDSKVAELERRIWIVGDVSTFSDGFRSRRRPKHPK